MKHFIRTEQNEEVFLFAASPSRSSRKWPFVCLADSIVIIKPSFCKLYHPHNTAQSVQPSTVQYSPVQPSTAQYDLIQSIRAQQNPVEPSSVQKSPLQATTAQYSPSSSLTLSYLNPIFLFRNRIVYFFLFVGNFMVFVGFGGYSDHVPKCTHPIP